MEAWTLTNIKEKPKARKTATEKSVKDEHGFCDKRKDGVLVG